MLCLKTILGPTDIKKEKKKPSQLLSIKMKHKHAKNRNIILYKLFRIRSGVGEKNTSRVKT